MDKVYKINKIVIGLIIIIACVQFGADNRPFLNEAVQAEAMCVGYDDQRQPVTMIMYQNDQYRLMVPQQVLTFFREQFKGRTVECKKLIGTDDVETWTTRVEDLPETLDVPFIHWHYHAQFRKVFGVLIVWLIVSYLLLGIVSVWQRLRTNESRTTQPNFGEEKNDAA